MVSIWLAFTLVKHSILPVVGHFHFHDIDGLDFAQTEVQSTGRWSMTLDPL